MVGKDVTLYSSHVACIPNKLQVEQGTKSVTFKLQYSPLSRPGRQGMSVSKDDLR